MYLKNVFPPLLQQFWSVWSDCTHMSLVFGDTFLAQGLHLKSHQKCSAGIRTWLFWLSLSCPDGQCSHQIQSVSRSDGGSAPRDKTSAETRTPGWAPETDPQWGPRHLDIHRENTTGTSGALKIWLCCSWNELLVRLAGGELPPRLSLVSTKGVFLHSVTDGVFVPCRCRLWLAQLGTLHFQWYHRLDCTDII